MVALDGKYGKGRTTGFDGYGFAGRECHCSLLGFANISV